MTFMRSTVRASSIPSWQRRDIMVKVAVVQMCSGMSVERNVASMERLAREVGWHLIVQFNGNEIEEHLEALNSIETDYVIDHIGKFIPPAAADSRQVDEILRLLDRGNAWFKICGCYETSLTGGPDYADVAAAFAHGGTTTMQRKQLALKAFRHTADYDTTIADYLAGQVAEEGVSTLPLRLSLELNQVQLNRYGENPHQQGGLYAYEGEQMPFAVLHGKEMSHNNWLDLDGAWQSAQDFPEPPAFVFHSASPSSTERIAGLALSSSCIARLSRLMSS